MEELTSERKEFVYTYTVALSDTDQFRHMSFANYLKLMFLATDALFLSFLDEAFLANHRFRLCESRMQFKKQTMAGDKIRINVNSSEILGPQFSLLYKYLLEQSGELVGLGHQKYELKKRSNGHEVSINLPENIKNVLLNLRIAESALDHRY